MSNIRKQSEKTSQAPLLTAFKTLASSALTMSQGHPLYKLTKHNADKHDIVSEVNTVQTHFMRDSIEMYQ